MASKKDKFLESAQRFLLKGQLDKAIRDYQQVVALDPKEIRYRQKLAELLVRDSRKEEAITQYEDIGKHYAENSYFLKAIAVYKQIQRLSPGDTAISLTIASLNHKQGLTGNALAEYGQVVVQLEQEGALKEVVKVLEQMIAVDGSQVATRFKYAETLFLTGSTDASFQAFNALMTSLQAGGDSAAAKSVSDRIDQLFPGQQENNLDLISARISAGDLDGAIASLQERVKRDSGNLQAWQLLCDAQRRKGNQAGLRLAYKQMMDLFPDDPTVLHGKIHSDIEAGDVAEALTLLENHLPLFIEKGAPQLAEELFLRLPADLAGDPRVKDGLRRIYETSGEWDKLNDLMNPAVQSSPQVAPVPEAFTPSVSKPSVTAVEPLSAFGPPSVALEAPAATEAPSAFGSPWTPEAPSTTSAAQKSQAQVPSASWEEEIELDLDDDQHSMFAEDPQFDRPASAIVAAPQNAVHATDIAAAPQVDLPLDFSLSLDLDEEDPFAETAPSDDDAEGTPFVSSDSSPFGELPASVGMSPFGDASPFAEASSPVSEISSSSDSMAPGDTLPQAAVAVDSEPVPSLELTLPEESELFPDFYCTIEAQLAEEAEEAEQAEQAEQAEVPAGSGSEPATRPLRGWQEIFPDTGSPADAAIDLEEFESHYDLGIGYKEMGMYNAAIKEFAVAAGNPQRRLDCLTLQAMCYREKGEPEKAAELLQRGRDLEVLSVEEQMSLSYELAFLLETTGALDEAIRLYREVHEVNPDFHDVAQRLFALAGDDPLDVIELEMEEDDF